MTLAGAYGLIECMAKKFIFCLVFLFIGCASEPVKESLHQVRCKYWLQKCHMKARARCAKGHKVRSSIRTDKIGGPHGAYKEFVMKFTCR